MNRTVNRLPVFLAIPWGLFVFWLCRIPEQISTPDGHTLGVAVFTLALFAVPLFIVWLMLRCLVWVLASK